MKVLTNSASSGALSGHDEHPQFICWTAATGLKWDTAPERRSSVFVNGKNKHVLKRGNGEWRGVRLYTIDNLLDTPKHIKGNK